MRLPRALVDAAEEGFGSERTAFKVMHTDGDARAMVTMLADGDPNRSPVMVMVDDSRSEFGRSRNPVMTLSIYRTDPRRLADALRVLVGALDAAAREIQSTNGVSTLNK